MKKSGRLSRRQFVGVAAAAAGAALLPDVGVTATLAQDPAVDAAATKGESRKRERAPWRIEPFPIAQVRLLDGPFKKQMDINNRWMLALPADRLLHTFRVNAGLPSKAEPLGGWEKPDCELRGHLVGGHYLSACALAYAGTGNDAFKQRGDEMVAELAKCQEKLGNGYLSAFPESFFDRLREGNPVWAPYYTIHKILAGHLDMYAYCGNEQALETAQKMGNWVGHWCQGISDAHMQRALKVEHGGMLESLYNLYALTGKGEYAYIGNRFTHNDVFDPLAEHRDELKGLHANTNIPKIIGVARRYELGGESRDRDIAQYFWDEVTSERCYVTGGTSNGEHWGGDPGKLSEHLGEYTEECCCGYNMMKLTRQIFGWTGDARAMDYFERTLWNSRLGTQDDEGRKGYFLPLGAGLWKYYNSQWDSFWCCTGTGIEEFAKFADTIYFHDDQSIWVNLFIASEVQWAEKGIRLRQETNFPEEERTTLTVKAEKPVELAVNIRVPYWATRGGTVKLNGEALPAFSSPSSYLTIKRVWKDGDRIQVDLPMSLRIEAMPDDSTIQAAMYGPLVLGGRLGNEGLTQELMYPGYDTAPRAKGTQMPEIDNRSKDPIAWIEPVQGGALQFKTAGQSSSTNLIPFYKIAGERYAVYWKVKSPNRWERES
ncbi:MAG TPA: beta-L-arabinofuranosidase domain-containing protein [Candidatus Acidoferrales bacterium]|nr:beta-L-arabinofuranosidase domain-containing protein [Candidatus Acidoferrales bacterium]